MNERRRVLTPDERPGARVGVRAYTQTTGMWVRGILAAEYGVPVEKVGWITLEGAHLPEYRDPPFVQRAASGNLTEMLRNGELDAAILGNDLPAEPGLVPLIRDPAAADARWYDAHRFVPVNHVVVVTKAFAAAHPDSVRAFYGLLKQGQREAEPTAGGRQKIVSGMTAMRLPMATVLDYCERQDLLPRKLTVDEVFADTRALLGDDAD